MVHTAIRVHYHFIQIYNNQNFIHNYHVFQRAKYILGKSNTILALVYIILIKLDDQFEKAYDLFHNCYLLQFLQSLRSRTIMQDIQKLFDIKI